MSYPSLTGRDADAVRNAIDENVTDDELDAIAAQCCKQVEGDDYPATTVDTAAQHAKDAWVATGKPTAGLGLSEAVRLESFMASRVHQTVSALPMDCREDFGFWRYLALFPYRWYLLAREPELQPQDYGGTNPHPDDPTKRRHTTPNYQLLLRTFLWGKIAYDPSESTSYRRATLVGETGGATTDVWHSHLVRVQIGQLGKLPHAFLDSICAEPRANGRDDGRDVEKRLTRMKHNVLFDVLDLLSARELVDAQKSTVLGSPVEAI